MVDTLLVLGSLNQMSKAGPMLTSTRIGNKRCSLTHAAPLNATVHRSDKRLYWRSAILSAIAQN
jgi:hypothetical protein